MCYELRSRSRPDIAFELRSDGGDPAEHGAPAWARQGRGECELLLIAGGVEEHLTIPPPAAGGAYDLCSLRVAAGKPPRAVEPCALLVVTE